MEDVPLTDGLPCIPVSGAPLPAGTVVASILLLLRSLAASHAVLYVFGPVSQCILILAMGVWKQIPLSLFFLTFFNSCVFLSYLNYFCGIVVIKEQCLVVMLGSFLPGFPQYDLFCCCPLLPLPGQFLPSWSINLSCNIFCCFSVWSSTSFTFTI